MSIVSSLRTLIPTLNALVIPTSLKEKVQSLILNWVESLLKKALNLELKVSSLPQQPVMAALQLVSLATSVEINTPLPEKLTLAAKLLYPQLPNTWKKPNGPLTESELLAVLRDGLRLSRSIQGVLAKHN